jgi:hypothetical protein
MGVLTDAGVDPARRVASLGALQPHPPAYTEPLGELITRLASSPKTTAILASIADWRVAAYFKPSLVQESALIQQQVLLFDTKEASRLLRLVATFLEGRLGVPAPLLEVIRHDHTGSDTLPSEQAGQGAIATPGPSADLAVQQDGSHS